MVVARLGLVKCVSHLLQLFVTYKDKLIHIPRDFKISYCCERPLFSYRLMNDLHAYSIQNWVEDLYWKQLDLNYPGMPDAMVRAGLKFLSVVLNDAL